MKLDVPKGSKCTLCKKLQTKNSETFYQYEFFLDSFIKLNQMQKSAYSSQINSHVPGYFIDVTTSFFPSDQKSKFIQVLTPYLWIICRRKYLFYALTGALASYVAWSPHLLLKRQCKYLIIIRIVLNLLILTI